MRRWHVGILLACLVVGTLGAAYAQDAAKAPPTVTLSVTDRPATEVAAEITRQSGVQVGIVSPCTATVSLELKDAKVEEAVKAFAEAFKASWMRAYLLESAPPVKPWTADQLLMGLQNQRTNWMNSLTDEQRQAMMQNFRGGFGQGGNGQQQAADMPGAGRSPLGSFGGPGARGGQGGPGGRGGQGGPVAPNAQGGQVLAPNGQPMVNQAGQPIPAGQGGQFAQGGQFGQGGQFAQGGQPGQPGGPGQGGQGTPVRYFDPVRQLINSVRTDSITLTLADEPLLQAQYDFTTVSGFLIAAGADLSGNVTLQVENKPIAEVMAAIAEAVDAKWRPIYILALPRVLSDAEQQAMQEQQFQSGWTQFWSMPANERAAEIQRRVDRIERFLQNNNRNGGQQTARFQNRGQRMMARTAQYAAGLSPEQRNELKPLLRALGKALNPGQ